MNYELVKQLKDLNFPFNWEKKCQKCEQEGSHIDCLDSVPSLSELIEACGKDFEALCLNNEDSMWQAYPTQEAFEKMPSYKIYPCIVDCCGYTIGNIPEEAVAKLWLVLQKNAELLG